MLCFVSTFLFCYLELRELFIFNSCVCSLFFFSVFHVSFSILYVIFVLLLHCLFVAYLLICRIVVVTFNFVVIVVVVVVLFNFQFLSDPYKVMQELLDIRDLKVNQASPYLYQQ